MRRYGLRYYMIKFLNLLRYRSPNYHSSPNYPREEIENMFLSIISSSYNGRWRYTVNMYRIDRGSGCGQECGLVLKFSFALRMLLHIYHWYHIVPDQANDDRRYQKAATPTFPGSPDQQQQDQRTSLAERPEDQVSYTVVAFWQTRLESRAWPTLQGNLC